jgi:23S rRNA (cytosine1962-C5)-methyltransferase
MLKLSVKTNRLGPILGRHPWVFSQAINNLPQGVVLGTPVELVDEQSNFLASGYFGSYSQIAVRLWNWDKSVVVDEQFFVTKIERASDLRKKYIDQKTTNAYRLVNSENDGLPGLIVDKYDDYLVVQFNTAGIEYWQKQIISALVGVIKPKGILEKSTSSLRTKENLPDKVGVLFGEIPPLVTIKENKYKFLVDMINGQKTGFFLDQRDNRLALQKYSKDNNVLNCFSYSGGFSVYALAGGAKKVVSVDVSAKALDLAKENMKLNKLDLDCCEFVKADVKEYLKTVPVNFYDTIILDPPAFIQNKNKKIEGLRGYKNINELALKVIKPEGVLVSCSCSAYLTLTEFRLMLSESGSKARRLMRILESSTHAVDHLQNVSFMESEYLKTYFLEVE